MTNKKNEQARRNVIPPALIGILTFAFAGCGPADSVNSENTPARTENAGRVERKIAVANLSPTEGNEASGTVTFIQETTGVRVIADLRDIGSGSHGFHIHENGDCSAPDATSAGGHFNPTNHPHGGPDTESHHVGDMGNVEATASGGAMLERVFESLSLEGENSIIGKAVIVHAGEDDLKSQPTGAAGARIACGVIRMSE